MIIAISTSTLYYLPFITTLNIIKSSGFECIELAGYWKGDNWEIAQHLKNIPVRDVLKMVEDSGLKISVLHDMGGVIDENSDSIISKDTYDYLEYSNTGIPCIVFHTPCKKTGDNHWWENYKHKAISDLNSIRGDYIVCIENIPFLDGYMVPLINPEEMRFFLEQADIYVNVDTTHYAQCNIGLHKVAAILNDRIKTIHLSDYSDGKSHVFIGDGKLNFLEFAQLINPSGLHSVTIECGIPFDGRDYSQCIMKCREAKKRTEEIFSCKKEKGTQRFLNV